MMFKCDRYKVLQLNSKTKCIGTRMGRRYGGIANGPLTTVTLSKVCGAEAIKAKRILDCINRNIRLQKIQ